MRPKSRGWGQGNEAEARALRSRPRLRPISWGGVKAEAKDKVMNKKYQMMIDSIHSGEFISLWSKRQFNFSFSLAQKLPSTCIIVWCPVVCKQTGQSLLDCWFFCCRLRPGRGQMFEAKAEAKALRPRPRPKFWPWSHFGRPLWPRGLNISAHRRIYQALGRQLPLAAPRVVIDARAWYTDQYENSRVTAAK